MRYPAELFEHEDLEQLRKRTGQAIPVVRGEVNLTTSDLRVFEKMISEASFSDRPNGSTLASTLLRATTHILSLNSRAKTVADSAAILAASLQVAALDPLLGSRLVSSLKMPTDSK